MWSGFGREERILVPSPAARTIAETAMTTFYRAITVIGLLRWERLRGEDSNPYTRHQKPLSYH
jgi:hypothetical protein